MRTPGCLAVLTVVAALSLTATAQSLPAFEVASVKRTSGAPGVVPFVFVQTGRLRAPFSTARDLIQAAFGVEQNQVVDGPDWIETDHFEVNATLPGGSSVADAPRMLQTLLADRFGLVARSRKRTLPVYSLEDSGKPAPQLTVAGAGCKPLTSPAGIPSPPPPPPPPAGAGPITVLNQPPGSKCGNILFNGFLSMRAVPIVSFVTFLSRQIRRPIIDRTGLTGLYDIDLSFLPDAGPMLVNGTAINADAPSLQTAVREQLGLRLESDRAPVDVIAIERIHQPTEN